MKITKQAKLNDQATALASNMVVLDLVTPGRGVFEITSQTKPVTGNKFEFSGQMSGQPMRAIMLGYVETVSELKTGHYKILVRELAASLNRMVPINLRHVTPGQVLEEISKQTGMSFVLPDSPWTNKTTPRFAHAGGGYYALDAILSAWQVQNPVWFAQSDGQIYLGELDKSIPGQKQIELPAELFENISIKGGTLPLMPRLRPGTKVKVGEQINIITSVEITGESMRLNWQTNPWHKLKAIA